MGTTESDVDYMGLAIQQARFAAERGEVPIGAVLVGRSAGMSAPSVLAVAHNQPVSSHDPTAHAEILVLREAARQRRNYRLEDCELFVTVEPCAMCAQAMLHARLQRVVFGATEPKTGAAGSVVDLFAMASLNHHTQVLGGVLAKECAGVLRAFFQQRRSEQRRDAQPLRDDALRTPAARFEPIWARYSQWRNAERWISKGVALQGLRLHVLDLQAPDVTVVGVPILFVHGPGQWWPQAATWVQDQLRMGRRIVLPDLIGHGQSDKPKKTAWHTLAHHAQSLVDVLDDLHLVAVELALAPGQQSLADVLQTLASSRIVGQRRLDEAECPPLPSDALDAPYPDKGHRAAARAWHPDSGWPDGTWSGQ